MCAIQLARKIPGAKIMVLTKDDRTLVLDHKFDHRDDPKLIRTLHAVRAAGAINERFWRPARRGEC